MNKPLEYLIEIDELAGDFYSYAAGICRKDHKLSDFFKNLSANRLYGRDTLLEAGKEIARAIDALFDATFTARLKAEYCAMLDRDKTLLNDASAAGKDLLDFALDIELSEPGRLYS